MLLYKKGQNDLNTDSEMEPVPFDPTNYGWLPDVYIEGRQREHEKYPGSKEIAAPYRKVNTRFSDYTGSTPYEDSIIKDRDIRMRENATEQIASRIDINSVNTEQMRKWILSLSPEEQLIIKDSRFYNYRRSCS